MSLQEKLSKISQHTQESKVEIEKKDQEKELEPIRERIKDLEVERQQLSLIKESLTLTAGNETGKGMTEYAKEIMQQMDKESGQLDVLIHTHKEALQAMGIQNREDLVRHPEFADDADVITYQKTQGQTAQVHDADLALKKKLETMGVPFSEDHFSYETATDAVTEKQQEIEHVLLQEKLKTPEGKAEVIETLAEDLEKSIPQVYFSQEEKTGGVLLTIGQHQTTILLQGNKGSFKKWHEVTLMPPMVSELTSIYGDEVVHQALIEAYRHRIEDAFEKSDTTTEKIAKDVRADLEKSSLEKGAEAKDAVLNFEKTVKELEVTLSEKAEILQKKGIHFDPVHIQGYGGTYKEVVATLGSQYYNQRDEPLIIEGVNHPRTYPPQFDFEALTAYVKERTQLLHDFIDAVKKIDTLEEVSAFTQGSESGVGQELRKVLAVQFHGIKKESYDPDKTSWEQSKIKVLMKFKSYDEAMDSFRAHDAQKEARMMRFLDMIEIAMEARIKRDALHEAEKKEKFAETTSIESEIKSIQRNREEAEAYLVACDRLEQTIPKEAIVFDEGRIRVLSVGTRLAQIEKDQEIQKNHIKELEAHIHAHDQTKPKLFAKGAWEKEGATLIEAKKDAEQKAQELAQSYREVYATYIHTIPVNQYSAVAEIIHHQKDIEGTPHEVFAHIKKELAQVIERKAPASVLRLNEEYKNLEEKLS